jgi:hypothetical protein
MDLSQDRLLLDTWFSSTPARVPNGDIIEGIELISPAQPCTYIPCLSFVWANAFGVSVELMTQYEISTAHDLYRSNSTTVLLSPGFRGSFSLYLRLLETMCPVFYTNAKRTQYSENEILWMYICLSTGLLNDAFMQHRMMNGKDLEENGRGLMRTTVAFVRKGWRPRKRP